MKKTLTMIIIFTIILGGLGAAAITNIDERQQKIINEKINIQYELENEELYEMKPGKTMISKILKTYELPFGIKKIHVSVKPLGIYEKKILNEIEPAPTPLLLNGNNDYNSI